MASPNTSRSWASAFRARTMLRYTELDNFSWFVANVINRAHPDTPIATAVRAIGHCDCGRVSNALIFWVTSVQYLCSWKFSERRVLRIVRPGFWRLRKGFNDWLAGWRRWSRKFCDIVPDSQTRRYASYSGLRYLERSGGHCRKRRVLYYCCDSSQKWRTLWACRHCRYVDEISLPVTLNFTARDMREPQTRHFQYSSGSRSTSLCVQECYDKIQAY